MSQLFTNNASGTLSAQAEIVGTTLFLQTNEGQLFPVPTGGDFFRVTMEDTSGNIEIVTCTTNANDELTVTRAQESTTAKVFPSGSKVELRPTAGTHDAFLQVYSGVMQGTLDMNNNEITDPVIQGGEIRNAPIRGTDGGTGNEIIVPTGAGVVTLGGQKIFHAGNDGVGSGLDADRFQALLPTAFIRPADDPIVVTGDWQFDGAVNEFNGDVTASGFGTGGRVRDGLDAAEPIGFNVMPYFFRNTDYTLNLNRNGFLINKNDASAVDFTAPDDSTIPVGATYCVTHSGPSGLVRVKGATGVTIIFLDGSNGATTSVVAANGFTLDVGAVTTIYKVTNTVWHFWGSGITTSA